MSSAEFERNLEKYAEIIVKVGLNLQAGQRLIIGVGGFLSSGALVEAAPLVRLVAKKAYQAGARYVEVLWSDEQLTLTRYQHAPRDSFEEISKWKIDLIMEYGQAGDALLSITSGNPDLLKGQDPELISTVQQVAAQHTKGYYGLIQKNAMNWLAAAIADPGWAGKALPDVPAEAREARLWEAIFEACRVKQDDPVSSWQKHVEALQTRCAYLNRKGYATLKYKAPGTELAVGLPKGHQWCGGGSTSQKGIFFIPNMPTEEVFTMPHRDKVDGVVSSTMPLSLNGSLIDNFSLTFEGGKVVKAVAEKGEVVLQRLLDTDESARHLGEVALVPHSSPISQSGLLFYNTLYDENASNHVALGMAYKFTMVGGETMPNEDFVAAGGNQSMIHVDFMIGSNQMDVDGVTEGGSVEPIMRAGEWAFKV